MGLWLGLRLLSGRAGAFPPDAKCEEEKEARQKTTGYERFIGFADWMQSVLTSLSPGNSRKREHWSLKWIQ
jgi:hypothetical protein